MPVYLIKPIPPSPPATKAREFICEDDPQALDLALTMARAGLAIEVWHGARLVGSAPAGEGAAQ